MKITFLGTNGWYDTKTGNTPCVLIETKNFYVVLDAGYGFAKLKDLAKKDKPIYLFISHFHLDHICGLHTLPLFNFKHPLTILAAKGMKKNFKTIVNHPFMAPFFGRRNLLSYEVKLMELTADKHGRPFPFECRPLNHIDNTFGYRLYLENKIIAYCSDTGPCESSIELGRNSDVLIHECGFLPGESNAWGHTNPEGAAGIAKKAMPKKLILTHLSADRYQTMASRKKAERIAKKIFPKTQAAFDGLTLTI